jgi:hypothetical protein
MIVAPERLTPGIIEMHWMKPMPITRTSGISAMPWIVAALHQPLDDEDGDAADHQRPGDHHRLAEQRLDMLVERQADHRGGNEGDHQVAQEAPRDRVALKQPHRDCPEGAPVEHHHRQDRAELDDDVEHRPGGGVIAEQLGSEDQMASGRDGQEFGDPLDNAEEDRDEGFAHAGLGSDAPRRGNAFRRRACRNGRGDDSAPARTARRWRAALA